MWIALLAIPVLLLGQYSELDCSFAALKPFVHSIPILVRRNVGIPLGIVIAPSDGWQIHDIFADALRREGCTNLDHLPLLSSEEKALSKYQ
jgi:hypothetical protein